MPADERVRIVQLLCPERHAVVAAAYVESEETFGRVVAQLETMLDRECINRWCGVCGSNVLRFEDARTKFRTMEEAMPWLKETERKNQLARVLFGRY